MKESIKGLKTLAPTTDPDCDIKRKKDGENKNKATLVNKIFLSACKAAGIEPTKRQASKWNKQRGLAYNFKK